MSTRSEPKLSDVLGALVPALRCADLDEALKRLLVPGLTAAGLAPDGIGLVLDSIRQRERVGSTAMGPVALPHGRVPGLDRMVAGLGANAQGVFEGDEKTTFVLAFASPASSAAEHLRFLARAAQLFRDDEARERLLSASDPEAMLAAVRSVEK